MIEFFTSFALELPWVFTTSPFKPKSGEDIGAFWAWGAYVNNPSALLLRSLIRPFFTIVIIVAPTPS